ncbi:GGDEF domain-containing protein [Thiolapillus sp.]
MNLDFNTTATAFNGREIPLLDVASMLQEQDAGRKGLLFALQSSLDPEQLLKIFFQHLNMLVPCQGMRYRNTEKEIDLHQGHEEGHCADYSLTLADERLGEVRFSRRRRFSDEEIRKMETLLASLALPMRNAIYYHTALLAASHDPLTGLRNRRSLMDNLAREIARARRETQALALMVIDIDSFKQVNDVISHLAGDQVLAQVADLLVKAVRCSDMVFRFAGDEFVLLLPNMDLEGARALSLRIREATEKMSCSYGEHQISVTLSIGSAILQEHMEPEEFFEVADLDMLCEKAKKHHVRCSLKKQPVPGAMPAVITPSTGG